MTNYYWMIKQTYRFTWLHSVLVLSDLLTPSKWLLTAAHHFGDICPTSSTSISESLSPTHNSSLSSSPLFWSRDKTLGPHCVVPAARAVEDITLLGLIQCNSLYSHLSGFVQSNNNLSGYSAPLTCTEEEIIISNGFIREHYPSFSLNFHFILIIKISRLQHSMVLYSYISGHCSHRPLHLLGELRNIWILIDTSVECRDE